MSGDTETSAVEESQNTCKADAAPEAQTENGAKESKEEPSVDIENAVEKSSVTNASVSGGDENGVNDVNNTTEIETASNDAPPVEVVQGESDSKDESEDSSEEMVENGNGEGDTVVAEDIIKSDAEAADEDWEKDVEKNALDDDEVKTNPAYIPKAGQFYMHDVRGALPSSDGENEEKPKASRADGKWTHDLFDSVKQKPKTPRELQHTYGFNIRHGDEERSNGNARRGPIQRKEGERRPTQTNGNRQERQRANGPRQQRQPRFRTFKRTVAPVEQQPANSRFEDKTSNATPDANITSAPRYQQKRDNRPRNGGPRSGFKQSENGARQVESEERQRTEPRSDTVSAQAKRAVPDGPPAATASSVQGPGNFPRPRQPTDAVYFDPTSHVQGPPPKPRERKRLEFVAPSP